MSMQTNSESSTTAIPDSTDGRSALCDASEAHQSTTAGSNTTPTSESDAPPSRSLKRTRDATGDTSPIAGLSPPSDTSGSDYDTSFSPSKRRKCEPGTETPDSTPEPPQQTKKTKKRVRFHPSTVDNSLWIDVLAVGKIGAPAVSPRTVTDTTDTGEAPTETGQGQSSTRPVVSPDSPDPSDQTRPASPFSFARLINPIRHATPASPTNLTRPSSPISSTILNRPITSSSSSGPQPLPSNAAQLPRVEKRRRLERSSFRATEFFKDQSWSNSRFHDRDPVISSEEEEKEEEESYCTDIADDDVWPRDDCDDESVPTASPPPSVRIKAMDVSAAEANRLQAKMSAKRQYDASKMLPSIYPRLLCGAMKNNKPMDESNSERVEPCPSPLQGEFGTDVRLLRRMFKKLPAEDAQKATDTLSRIIGHLGQFYFERGFLECVMHQQKRTTQNRDSTSAS